MEKKQERTYPIICHVSSKQSVKGVCVRFSRDDRDFYVPVNEPVNVPEWVYDIYVDSEWNEDNRYKGMNAEHLGSGD